MPRGGKYSADVCPGCGLLYKDLRTGLTYRDVFLMYWSPDSDPSTWQYKRRSTILGKWHQIKREYWDYHTTTCGKEILECVPF